MYKDNSKFNLNKKDINRVMYYVKSNNIGVRYNLHKSPNYNSNSFYITIFYKSVSGIIRLSDHDTRMTAIGAKLKSFVIGKNTTIKNVCNIVQERIDNLKYKQRVTRLDYLFDLIKREN